MQRVVKYEIRVPNPALEFLPNQGSSPLLGMLPLNFGTRGDVGLPVWHEPGSL